MRKDWREIARANEQERRQAYLLMAVSYALGLLTAAVYYAG